MRIHQHTEVTDVTVVDNQVRGVTTPHGDIAAPIVVNCTAAWSTLVSDMAGVRLPISAFPLQAAVTEPVRPFLPTVVVSGTLHVDINQTDRGELVFGASVDPSPRTRPAAASPSPRASGTYSSSCRRPSQLRLLRQGAGLRDIDVRLLADHGRDAGRAGPGRRRLGTRGFTAGPVAGEAMARLIATGKTPELIAASMSPASPTAGQSASGAALGH